MISYPIYKVLHLAGVFMVLLSLGGLIALAGEASGSQAKWRRLGGITNGVGLLLIFIAGFGLIARLQIGWPWPGWILFKILIWMIFGALMALANRMPQWSLLLWWGALILAATAAYLANLKPF